MSLLENIKLSEGFRSKVYKCTEGFDTIGYGFAIKDLELDEDICELILKRKIGSLKLRIDQRFDWFKETPTEAQDVIIEMCYQLGINGFSKFKKTIQHIINKDFRSAAVEMLQSKWASQTPNRAKKLSKELKYVK